MVVCSFLQHRRALLSPVGRMGRMRKRRRRRRKWDFSLAEKYSHQMSVPLWDTRAHIQTIPGVKFKKSLCVSCV